MGVVGKIWDVVSCQRRSSGLGNPAMIVFCNFLNSGVPPPDAEKSEGVLTSGRVDSVDMCRLYTVYFDKAKASNQDEGHLPLRTETSHV